MGGTKEQRVYTCRLPCIALSSAAFSGLAALFTPTPKGIESPLTLNTPPTTHLT